MKRLTREAAAGPGTPGDGSRFSGSVEVQAVLPPGDRNTVQASVVSFFDGARTHWHSHAGGQVLHVIEGAGRVQSRGEPAVDLRPGDIAVASAGEMHWHGAAEGASMRHLAISIGDVDWQEPVEPGEL